MDLKQFTQAIQQIADEKGIAKEKIVEAIEMSLAAAYKRDYGKRGQIVRVKLDPDSGKATVKQVKIVVDETMIKSEEEVKAEEEARMIRLTEGEREEKRPSRENEEFLAEELEEKEKKVRFNPERHIMIEEARAIKPEVKPGDELDFSLEYHEDYGRIAAQTAKQVIIQRIREVERESVFDEYKGKEGELVSGIVQRVEGRNVFLDLGRSVGVLPPEEQIPYERYRLGERLKALVILVEKNPRGPGVFLSRSHPRLIKKLFELEVPEIAAGTVEMKAIAREPGSRSKVAVVSHDSAVDPVGSLVGQKGVRVSTVINELGGEKIDVIEWSEEPAEFVANSLSPAKVLDVDLNDKRKEARAIVPDEQLSLAIGKGGQNVRLAAKLTGWKIDVRSSKKPVGVVEEKEEPPEEPTEISPEAKEELKEVLKEATEIKEEAMEESSSAKASEDKEKPTEEKKPKKKKISKKKPADESQKTKDEN